MGIYLDNGATSFPKPESVYTAMDSFMRKNGTSAGRGTYALARESEEMVYRTRKSLATLIGAPKARNIVLTGNVTESLNMVLKGFLRYGDTVLTSSMEHNAMWRPLHALQQELNLKIITFSSTPDCGVDLQEIRELMKQGISLVAMIHGSNVLGGILPVKEIAEIARERNIPVLVDAAQTTGAFPFSVTELDVDFLAFTGHKSLLGPMGTGGFYIRDGMELRTWKEGGTGTLSKSVFQPEHAPDRFEAGTLNLPGIAGIEAACDFINQTGVDAIRQHETDLMDELLKGLLNRGQVEVYGPQKATDRLGLVSFNIKNENPYDVAKWMDEHAGIMVRAGLHCCPCAHQLAGTLETGAIRASVGFFNTSSDIRNLLEALDEYIRNKQR